MLRVCHPNWFLMWEETGPAEVGDVRGWVAAIHQAIATLKAALGS